MTQKKHPFFHSSIHRLASSRPGAWLFARMMRHVDHAVLKLSNNKATLTSLLTQLPVVMLTSTGAKSGLPRQAPLLGIQNEANPNQIAVIASNFGQSHYPGWYYNLKANPQATCLFNDRSGDYISYEAEGDEYDKFWQLAVDTYMGYPHYKKRIGNRHIPIMVLTLIRS